MNTLSTATSLGFVGLGRMGANMARCLKDRGHTIKAVFDVDKQRAELLAEDLGCMAADTLADVTAACEVVLTVVSDDAAMEQIFSEVEPSLLTGAEGRLFLNCATVSPEAHKLAAQRAKAAGADTLECLMASSIPQARNGELFLMVGGDKAVFEQAQPLLDQVSKACVYIGEAGQAATMKLLVNMVMNINTAAAAEGLGLAHALGLDLTLVREIFAQTGANSRALETDGESMQIKDYDAFFSCEHAAKDSRLALELAREKEVPVALATKTAELYDQSVAEGLGHLDKAAIFELMLKEEARVKTAALV